MRIGCVFANNFNFLNLTGSVCQLLTENVIL
jgi:hypothetical protein